LNATHRVIVEEQRAVVERLLCEKIFLHGICRVIGVNLRWLMDFMVAGFAAVLEHLHVQPIASSRHALVGCLGVEAAQLQSFVQRKTTPSGSNPLRQHVSRLVLHTLAFSKNVENHIGAIRYVRCYYNLTRAAIPV